MEVFLNLAWAVLAALMFGVWLRAGARQGSTRRVQFVALAVLAAILFPVISVTDDLQAAQNPAEVDSCVRRAHERSIFQSVLSGAAALPPPVIAAASFGPPAVTLLCERAVPFTDHAALAPIQNRPPPAA